MSGAPTFDEVTAILDLFVDRDPLVGLRLPIERGDNRALERPNDGEMAAFELVGPCEGSHTLHAFVAGFEDERERSLPVVRVQKRTFHIVRSPRRPPRTESRDCHAGDCDTSVTRPRDGDESRVGSDAATRTDRDPTRGHAYDVHTAEHAGPGWSLI